jgi:hypothetical protein
VSKWIKFEKSSWGFSAAIVIFNKIAFYCGRTDHWGIGANVNFYDRSITFEILNLYLGVEVWYKDNGPTEFVPRSSGDLLD